MFQFPDTDRMGLAQQGPGRFLTADHSDLSNEYSREIDVIFFLSIIFKAKFFTHIQAAQNLPIYLTQQALLTEDILT